MRIQILDSCRTSEVKNRVPKQAAILADQEWVTSRYASVFTIGVNLPGKPSRGKDRKIILANAPPA